MPDDPVIWAAIITASLALIGTLVNYFKSIKQDQFKAEMDRKLASLTSELQTEREERLAHLESSLKKVQRLEASRSVGYEKIWSLTGSLNLFGPTIDLDISEFSTGLKTWYFSHGLLLKKDSKKLYFLAQEVLNYAILRSASFKRPPPDKLYGEEERPSNILNNLRTQYFRMSDNRASVAELESIVTEWKMNNYEHKEQDERNWVLLQLLLSRFRSSLIRDLGLDPEDTKA